MLKTHRRRILFVLGILALFVVLSSCQSRREPGRIICGGLGSFACPAQAYCYYEKNCGGIDREGYCVIRPNTCPNETEEVCGCDGETHASACFAAIKGISIKHLGRCKESQN